MFTKRVLTAPHSVCKRPTLLVPLKLAAPRPPFTSAASSAVNPGSPTQKELAHHHTAKISSPRARSQQLSSHFSTSTKPSKEIHQEAIDDTMATATLPTRGGYDAKASEKFTARKIGSPFTLEHRVYIEKD